MQLFRVRRAEIVDVAVLCGESDRIDHQRIAVLVMTDGFAEPRRFHIVRMLAGEKYTAHHVVTLPDHPHLLRRLDEIKRLRRKQQLSGYAAGIASRLSREGDSSLTTQRLFIRRAHLRRGPRL